MFDSNVSHLKDDEDVSLVKYILCSCVQFIKIEKMFFLWSEANKCHDVYNSGKDNLMKEGC